MIEKSLYWEDFTPGKSWMIDRPDPVGQKEIVDFAREFDPLDIHIDPERAVYSPLGIHCASGVHTFGMAQRMLCDAFLLQTHIVAGGRIDEFIMPSPVLQGDQLQLLAQVIQSNPHISKEDRGWTVFEVKVSTSDQRLVLVYKTSILIMRRSFREPS